jgi:hypothetical protein
MNNNLSKIEKVPIFFILGSPRSGTYLLRFILDSHENIYIPLENPYIPFLYKKYKNTKKWNDISFEKLYHDLTLFKPFSLWKTDKNKLKKEILEVGANASFQTICKIIHSNYYSITPKKEILIIGDKNPPYAVNNKVIRKLFPDAKYIHLVRDYRGFAFSMLKTDIFRPIVSSLITRWKYQNKKIEKFKVKIPGNFTTVRYEDLVDDPEITIKRICTFLNIEYKAEMIQHSQRENLNTVFNENVIGKYHNSLTESINSSKKDEWRKGLSEHQIKICDYIVGSFSEKYNFIPIYKHFSNAFKLKCLPGKIWGYLYFPFLKLFSILPFNLLSILIRLLRKIRKLFICLS